jgi:hypothetical protein
VWLPDGETLAGIVMVGGSGPADRHNDVFFPPIREHLLNNNIAVLSYDKRGVGESSGTWVAASIDDFAADAVVAYDALRSHVDCPVGLFGHSEGGWVVLRAAAACADRAFVVTNSTPGMTPAEQDRFSVDYALRAAGEPSEVVASALAFYDKLVQHARRGTSFADVQPLLLSEPAFANYYGDIDEEAWRSVRPKLDHDPVPDIAGLSCPHLAVFGELDPLVPVPPSVAAFRSARSDVAIKVFPGADHRLRTSDDAYAPGYLQTLTEWIHAVVDPR